MLQRSSTVKNALAGNAVITLLELCAAVVRAGYTVCGKDLCVSAFSLKQLDCFRWAPAWINVRRLRLKTTPPCRIGISRSIFKPQSFSECLEDQNQLCDDTDITLPVTSTWIPFKVLWFYPDFTVLAWRIVHHEHSGVHNNNMAFAYPSMLLYLPQGEFKTGSSSLFFSFTESVSWFVWWDKCRQPICIWKELKTEQVICIVTKDYECKMDGRLMYSWFYSVIPNYIRTTNLSKNNFISSP